MLLADAFDAFDRFDGPSPARARMLRPRPLSQREQQTCRNCRLMHLMNLMGLSPARGRDVSGNRQSAQTRSDLTLKRWLRPIPGSLRQARALDQTISRLCDCFFILSSLKRPSGIAGDGISGIFLKGFRILVCCLQSPVLRDFRIREEGAIFQRIVRWL